MRWARVEQLRPVRSEWCSIPRVEASAQRSGFVLAMGDSGTLEGIQYTKLEENQLCVGENDVLVRIADQFNIALQHPTILGEDRYMGRVPGKMFAVWVGMDSGEGLREPAGASVVADRKSSACFSFL